MGLPFAMAGAAYALLQTGVLISLGQAIAGLIAVFLLTGAVHTVDDYFDRQRDRLLWPNRQISSRALRPKYALLISAFSIGIGFALVVAFYNLFCVLILGIATTWAIAYTGYFRERLGYLTLPFAIGLFPIGGYAAFSSSTIWANPIPWLLFLMVFFWQSAHILAYSPPHGVKNGKTSVPLFIRRFSPKFTLICSGVFAGACMSIGIFLFYLTKLNYFYLVVTIGLGGLIVGLSFFYSTRITLKNCMNLVFLHSMYGWLIFLLMTLDFLFRYNLIYFYVILAFGIIMILLTSVLDGFGAPNITLEESEKK